MAEGLPIAPMGRILKTAGADRVSDDAKVALAKVLEDKGQEIAALATKYANHANRKTVQEADIELAVKHLS